MEQIVILAVAFLLLLLRFAGRLIRRAIDTPASREREAPRARFPSRVPPPDRKRDKKEVPPVRRQPRDVPLPSPAGRTRVLSLREARRGIVLMTILGSCRALE